MAIYPMRSILQKILAFPGIAIAKTRDRFTVFRISPGMRS